MKIVRVTIAGFRSFRVPQTIELKQGRNLCLLAENGRGKSSVADALEFWGTGDVGWVHREDVGLGALIHLEADEAMVEVRTDGRVASRTLRGSRPGALEAGQGPMDVGFNPGPIPLLRHRTMADFVDKTSNDKRTELLTVLGLSRLVTFRLGLRAAARKTKSELQAAVGAADVATAAWVAALEGEGLQDRLKALSSTAQLQTPLQDEAALMHFAAPAASAPTTTSRLFRIDELVAANEAVAESSVDAWNTAIADRAVAAERGVSALLEAGRRALPTWDKDSCPLCEVNQPRADLLQRVERRAIELAEADARFSEAAEAAEDRQQAVVRLGRALRAVVDDERNASWAGMPSALERLASLRDELKVAGEARRAKAPLAAAVTGLPAASLVQLRAAALREPGDAGPALVDLARLRSLLASRHETEARVAGLKRALVALEAAVAIAALGVERAIGEALDGLNTTLSAYYARLIGTTPYSDLRLEYHERRTGGVEFNFRWNGTHDVNPPQRVMSESQLAALGLSLFLARLKNNPDTWRTMVLDDVVTSFDVVHRARLVRLLQGEFGDWQILMLTHDAQLARTIQDESTTTWRQMKVTGWTPADGPVFGESDARKRLAERLARGDAADELGGIARQALEQALERPIRKMALEIRHDPANRYSADDYRRALLAGLDRGNYPHAQANILKQLSTDGSTTNRACHFKDHDPGITTADLELLLEDLDALDAIFVCGRCGGSAWQNTGTSSPRATCGCGDLTCA